MTLIIDPAGTGDYTSIALAVAADPADGTWECWVGNVGAATITNATAAAIHIYSRLADRVNHLAMAQSGTESYILNGTISIQRHDVRVTGMDFRRETGAATNSIQLSGATCNNAHIEFNRFTFAGNNCPISAGAANVTVTGLSIHDNAINVVGTVQSAMLVGAVGMTATASMTGEIYNNSIVNTGAGAGFGMRILSQVALSNSATTTLEIHNNISMNFASGDFEAFTTGTGTPVLNLTASSNATLDATADEFGGTGNFQSLDLNAWFADIPSSFALAETSPGVGAGNATYGDNIGVDQTTVASRGYSGSIYGAFKNPLYESMKL